MSKPPLHHLFHPDNVSAYVDTVTRGVDHLATTMLGLAGPATGATADQAAKLVADVDLDVPVQDLDAALEEISRLYLDDAVWFHDPAYAAHLNCPIVIPALLAELFVSSVNSSLDTFDQSVGGTYIERHLIDWTADRIGFARARRDGIFTSGGTQSNLQALLLARNEVVERRAVPTDRLRILASADGHFSVQKAARLLGLAAEAVVLVPTDRERRIDVPALERAVHACLAEDLVPMAVVATAGTTDFGVIDPLARIAAVCAEYDAWFHVDAAYGGGLLASPRRRHLLDGIELAESVTVDYHKTFFQPVSASAVIVRDARTLRHVTHHADYLNPQDSADPNQVDKSIQTTRRFDALKLWLTLRIMGPDRIGEYFDVVIDLAHEVYDELERDPDFEVAAVPVLSTLVFRYAPPDLPATEVGPLNARIRSLLYESGTGMVAATKLDGSTWLKFTLLNPMATVPSILALVDSVREIGQEVAPGSAATRVERGVA